MENENLNEPKNPALQQGDVSGELPLSDWLQKTMKGRHLMMQITFPIANQFKTHPEKIPIELVVEIVEAVRDNFR